MIEVNGEKYITLSDDFYVGNQKVIRAYANGSQVYPSGGGNLIKVYGEATIHAQCTYPRDEPLPLVAGKVGNLHEYTVDHTFTGEFVVCIRGEGIQYENCGEIVQNVNDRDEYGKPTGIRFPPPSYGGQVFPTISVTKTLSSGGANRFYFKGMIKAKSGSLYLHPYYQIFGESRMPLYYHRYEMHDELNVRGPYSNWNVMKNEAYSQSFNPYTENEIDHSTWYARPIQRSTDEKVYVLNGVSVSIIIPSTLISEYCKIYLQDGVEIGKDIEDTSQNTSNAEAEIGYIPITKVLYYGDYDTAPEWAKDVNEDDLN